MFGRTIKIAVALTALIVAIVVATPLLLSNERVKQRVAAELSQMTGRDVRLVGTSSVTLRPYLGVAYRDVRIGQEGSGSAIMRAESVQVGLAFASALFGRPSVARVEFDRPVITMKVARNGTLNFLLPDGPLLSAAAAEPGSAEERLSLGTFVFRRGTLRLRDESSGTTRQVTDVNATLDWPRAASRLALDGSGIWQGQRIGFDGQINEPLALLRGQSSNMALRLRSPVGRADIEGKLYAGTTPNLDGKLDIAISSLRALGTLAGAANTEAIPATGLRLEGPIKANGNRIDMPEVNGAIAGQEARGQLQLTMSKDGAPALDGTVAFTTLSLPPLSGDDTGLTARLGQLAQAAKATGLSADIRLSATSADAAPLRATNVALGLLVSDATTTLDIGQATLAGGAFDGSLSLAEAEARGTLSLNGGDFTAIAPMVADWTGPLSLTGTGNARLTIGHGSDGPWNGKLLLDARDGVLNGLALPLTTTDAATTGSATPFERLILDVDLMADVATVSTFALTAQTTSVNLEGRTEFARGLIALRGRTIAEAGELGFFVGGTLADPLIIPTSKRPAPAPGAPDGPTITQ